MRVRRPTYTAEFKADAVELLRTTERTLVQVAKDLGVSYWSLREWYKKAEMAKNQKPGTTARRPRAPAEETPEQRLLRLEREVALLRKENESLKMDREILKKAAAFFAKENE
jgi:transposase-like protein